MSSDAGMADLQERLVPLPALSLVAVATGLAGIYLVGQGGREAISGGVLLLILSLASAGVVLGGASYGPAVEGRLDLSARIGLGWLGGTLGAAVSALLQWVLGWLRLPVLFGVALPAGFTSEELVFHLLGGAVWGTLFGVVLPLIPGRAIPSRGAVFSLVPSLYVLLKVFPVDQRLGLFGLDLGTLTFVFVVALNLVWGLVTAATVAWGTRSQLAPVSRYLGEPPGD